MEGALKRILAQEVQNGRMEMEGAFQMIVVKDVQGEKLEMEGALQRILLEEVQVTSWKWKVHFGRFQQRRFKMTTKIKGAFKRTLTKAGKGGKQESMHSKGIW